MNLSETMSCCNVVFLNDALENHSVPLQKMPLTDEELARMLVMCHRRQICREYAAASPRFQAAIHP